MNLHTFALFGLCQLLFGCAASVPASPHASPQLQVIAAETAFAKTLADRDHQKFATYIADDAVFYAGDQPLTGKQQVTDWWARYFTAPEAPFSWLPEDVVVLDGATLAHSSGPVLDASGKLIARFNSIWRRDTSGNWLVIFDKGSDVCAQ